MAQNNISLGLSLPWTPSGGPSYSAQATTLFAAMEGVASPADATRKGVINTCINALVSAGLWDKIDVLQVYAAHSTAVAVLNWKTPGVSRTATLISAPTFVTDRGYTTNGSNNYIDTQFNPGGSDVYAQNSAHYGLWVRSTAQFGSTPCGYVSSNSGTSINPRSSGDAALVRINSNNGTTTSNATVLTAAGLTIANRNGATSGDVQIYKNGSALGISASTPASIAPVNGSLRTGNSLLGFGAGDWAIMHAGSSLTAQNASDLYTILGAYMTAIGA